MDVVACVNAPILAEWVSAAWMKIPGGNRRALLNAASPRLLMAQRMVMWKNTDLSY